MCFVRGCFCAISLFVCVISFSSACLVRVLHCLWHRILCPHMQVGESVPIRKLVNKSRNKSSQSTSSPPPFSSPAPPLQAGEWKYSFRCCSWARAPRGIVTRQGVVLLSLYFRLSVNCYLSINSSLSRSPRTHPLHGTRRFMVLSLQPSHNRV